MADKNIKLKNRKTNDILYPQTKRSLIVESDGTPSGVYSGQDIDNLLDNKANVDGYYVDFTSGLTKGIIDPNDKGTNYGGTFIARETANGQAIGYEGKESSVAEIKAIKGNTIKSKNLFTIPNQTNNIFNIDIKVENQIIFLNSTTLSKTGSILNNPLTLPKNDYSIYVETEGLYENEQYSYSVIILHDGKYDQLSINNSKNKYIMNLKQANITGSRLYINPNSKFTNYKVKIMILNGLYTLDNVPPYETHFEGLRSATPTELKSYGTNLCDQVLEVGSIGENGSDDGNPFNARTKYIEVLGNKKMVCKAFGDITTKVGYFYAFAYDVDKKFISKLYCGKMNAGVYYSINIPSNAKYLRILFTDAARNGLPANPQITLTFGTIQPKSFIDYVEPNSVLTHLTDYAPDGLKSAGTAHDELTPTQYIKRIGKVDLSTIDWTKQNNGRFIGAGIQNLVNTSNTNNGNTKGNIICNIYENVVYNGAWLDDKLVSLSPEGWLWIVDKDITDKKDIKGTLYYELLVPIITPITPKLDYQYQAHQNGTEIFDSELPVTADILYIRDLVGKLSNDYTRYEIDQKFGGLNQKFAAKNGTETELVSGGALNLIASKPAISEDTFITRETYNGSAFGEGRESIKAIKGNTIVANQIVKNYNFNDTQDWIAQGGKLSISKNIAKVVVKTAEIKLGVRQLYMPFVKGHKYYVRINLVSFDLPTTFTQFNISGSVFHEFNNELGIKECIVECKNDNKYIDCIAYGGGEKTIVGNTIEIGTIQVMDLTTCFDTINVPTDINDSRIQGIKNWLEKNPEYNLGTLISTTPTELKSYGTNMFNNSWIYGKILPDGTIDTSVKQLLSKDFIPVVGGKNYTLNSLTMTYPEDYYDCYVCFYDENKNPVSQRANFFPYKTSPANAKYMRINFYKSGVDWDKPLDFDYQVIVGFGTTPFTTYVPHIAPNSILTHLTDYANELRGVKVRQPDGSFTEARDKLTSTQYIKVMERVDLGTLYWAFLNIGTPNVRIYASLPKCKLVPRDTVANLICSDYVPNTKNDIYLHTKNKIIASGDSVNQVLIYDSQIISKEDIVDGHCAKLEGVILEYELAEPVITPITPKLDYDYLAYNKGIEEWVGTDIPVPCILTYNPDLREKLEGMRTPAEQKNIDDKQTQDIAELQGIIANYKQGDIERGLNMTLTDKSYIVKLVQDQVNLMKKLKVWYEFYFMVEDKDGRPQNVLHCRSDELEFTDKSAANVYIGKVMPAPNALSKDIAIVYNKVTGILQIAADSKDVQIPDNIKIVEVRGVLK